MQFHGTADLWSTAGADVDRDALLRRGLADVEPRRHAAQRRLRPGRGLHLRPRALGRLHAPGQPGLGRDGARLRARHADPVGRSLLRRQAGRHPARLGQPRQGRHPAGRRAAAPARRPGHGHERRPDAAAALLVPPARREGGGRHDRRRPRPGNGTAGQFAGFKADSPADCSVANWECIRSTSYVFPDTSIPNAEALESDGFEIALHLHAGCPNNFTPASLRGQLGRPAAGVAGRHSRRSTCR